VGPLVGVVEAFRDPGRVELVVDGNCQFEALARVPAVGGALEPRRVRIGRVREDVRHEVVVDALEIGRIDRPEIRADGPGRVVALVGRGRPKADRTPLGRGTTT